MSDEKEKEKRARAAARGEITGDHSPESGLVEFQISDEQKKLLIESIQKTGKLTVQLRSAGKTHTTGESLSHVIIVDPNFLGK